MNPAHIIAKKRDGHSLSREEISRFVHEYTRGQIPDYQMSALAMAIYLRGMSAKETADLTDAMLQSGVRLVWPQRERPIVDKHSTGGIGDKTSLVLAPLLASCGLAVPMISGRGLGATGGTLDKLEAIPGFRTNLSLAEIQSTVERVGCVITGASAEIVPADRKLYALRDVTATVPSIPLITASIMSKKLAESLDALVLDVKFGSGAFMKSQGDARTLARSLVDTGRRMGVRTSALLTDMNQPLGRMAGNLVEVHESLATLEGRGPADLWDCTRELAAELLVLAMQAADHQSARHMLDQKIASGEALARFREMAQAQGGDLDRLPPLPAAVEIAAERSGFVLSVNTEQLGHAIIELGGGRKLMSDAIDHAAGLEMCVRIGDRVEEGQPLVRAFGRAEKVERVRELIAGAFAFADQPVPPLPLIVERVE
ncbi:MAG TPA: thymidine phosphorylase [Pirellulaceae bacterium]|nr:thymidine phosphorylase [Pirellulaceae bacterium]